MKVLLEKFKDEILILEKYYKTNIDLNALFFIQEGVKILVQQLNTLILYLF